MEVQHRPVMLSEVVEALQISTGGCYLDATFGRGGHSRAVLERLGTIGQLWALDQDPEAILTAQRQFAEDKRFHMIWDSFANLASIDALRPLKGQMDGVLFDLGVSSPQLDTAERGFSFLRDGPLDMRMNPQKGITVADWLATVSVEELAEVLRVYGEERFAWRIAQRVVNAQAVEPIVSTVQLAEIVAKAHPAWQRHQHPATRTFQALRLRVNQELEALQQALPTAEQLLKPGGRLVVISFHSLEDRIVKRFMQDQRQQRKMRPVIKKAWPSTQEVESNPRARSAILRVMEKCNEAI